MARFQPHTGNVGEDAALTETEDLQRSFQFSLNVVAHVDADLEQIQASISDLVRNKIRWPVHPSDVQISIQESDEGGAEYHMEDHTDTPSRSWTGSVSVELGSPASASDMESAALLAETEDLVDDLGNIRFISLGN